MSPTERPAPYTRATLDDLDQAFAAVDTDRNAERLADVWAGVDRAATHRRAGWYTRPVRWQAVQMCDAMLTAADDIANADTADQFSTVTDLPGACLDVAATLTRRGAEVAAPDAGRLLDTLLAALLGHGITAYRRGYAIVVDDQAGPVTYRWRYPLVVALHSDPAWDLTYDSPTWARIAAVHAPFTADGAEAIADMVAALASGDLPDPFTRP